MFETENKKRTNQSIEDIFNDFHIEKMNVIFSKYLLGVNKKPLNLAVKGELGRYPLYIDVVLSMLNYWIRFHDRKVTIKDNHLVLETLKENESMLNKDQSCYDGSHALDQYYTILVFLLFFITRLNVIEKQSKHTNTA